MRYVTFSHKDISYFFVANREYVWTEGGHLARAIFLAYS